MQFATTRSEKHIVLITILIITKSYKIVSIERNQRGSQLRFYMKVIVI